MIEERSLVDDWGCVWGESVAAWLTVADDCGMLV